MKIGYEKELNKISLHIDLPRVYEEDYQIHMLQENHISGLLDITGCGMEGKSRYTYTVTGMESMKGLFKDATINKQDMLCFVKRLMEVVKGLKRYMLNADGLLLYPEFIFCKEGTWLFCYLPDRRKDLSKAFHVITEYFVTKLDYNDSEGIMLAYELHKATLEESYDLEKIMDTYIRHETQRNNMRADTLTLEEAGEDISEETIFSLEEKYEPKAIRDTVQETRNWRVPWKKTMHKLKGKGLGSWRDLIFETDGQDKEDLL